MVNFLIALPFVAFVASPAIVASLPAPEPQKEPEERTKGADLPVSSVPISQ
jgi:hypothetical protein